LSNRRCAASRTSQAFHRRALSPSGELREKTDQLAVQSQVLAELNQQLEQRVADQVGEIERVGRLRRFLPPQVADLIVASGTEKQLESHRRRARAANY
jgi:adenylate cyclase